MIGHPKRAQKVNPLGMCQAGSVLLNHDNGVIAVISVAPARAISSTNTHYNASNSKQSPNRGWWSRIYDDHYDLCQFAGRDAMDVFMFLRHIERGTGGCSPSQEWIARRLCMGVRTVQRAIVKLVKIGVLVVTRRRNLPNRYETRDDRIASLGSQPSRIDTPTAPTKDVRLRHTGGTVTPHRRTKEEQKDNQLKADEVTCALTSTSTTQSEQQTLRDDAMRIERERTQPKGSPNEKEKHAQASGIETATEERREPRAGHVSLGRADAGLPTQDAERSRLVPADYWAGVARDSAEGGRRRPEVGDEGRQTRILLGVLSGDSPLLRERPRVRFRHGG